jgi:hypothetical protein
MTKLFSIAAVSIALLVTAAVALSVSPQKRNDPKRPVASISRALDITAAQFVACFDDVNPAPAGTKTSGRRERANKAILLPCLQRANPAITNARLDAVMDAHRPEGRVR